MNEAQFQKRITDLCDWLKLPWYHANDPRRDNAGFPDLVIVGKSNVIFAELKTEKGRMSVDQKKWMGALKQVDTQAYLWRPSDWNEIVQVLTQQSRRKNQAQ